MIDEIPEIDSASDTDMPTRGNGIDTDQIILARFMEVVMFDGLGEFVFSGQCYDESDGPRDHPLNEPQFQGAFIMVVNVNFGCGSSREYAPQALMHWGIDAIVGESFAEIFVDNCLTLSIPTVTAGHETVTELQNWVDEHPDGDIDMSVENEAVTYGDTTVDVIVDDAQRKALTEGVWGATTPMESNADAVAEKTAALPHIDD